MATYKRYYKEIKYYLGKPVVPTIIRKGELIEEGDFDSLEECENDNYTLVEIKGECICDYNIDTDNYCRYKKMQKYYNNIPSNPPEYVKGDIIYCGCNKEECNGAYRYRDSLQTMCNGEFGKLNIYRKQKSIDCGQTWENTDEYTVKDFNGFDINCGTNPSDCGAIGVNNILIDMTPFTYYKNFSVNFYKFWYQNGIHYLLITGRSTTKSKTCIYSITYDTKMIPTIKLMHSFTTNTLYLDDISIPYIDDTKLRIITTTDETGFFRIILYEIIISTGIMTLKNIYPIPKSDDYNKNIPYMLYMDNNNIYGIRRGVLPTGQPINYKYELDQYIIINIDNPSYQYVDINGFKNDINFKINPVGFSYNLKHNRLERMENNFDINQNNNFNKLVYLDPYTFSKTGEENFTYNNVNYNNIVNAVSDLSKTKKYFGDYYLNGYLSSLFFLKSDNCNRITSYPYMGLYSLNITNNCISYLSYNSVNETLEFTYEYYL